MNILRFRWKSLWVLPLTLMVAALAGCPDSLAESASPWHIEAVDTVGNVGSYASIALDGNDYPHISYFDTTNGDLKYVRWTGSFWDGLDGTPGPDAVDTTEDVGWYTSIALDGNGYPHISYFDATNYYLKYVRWTGTTWDGLDVTAGPDAVDTTDSVGDYTSIALAGNGYPHISYFDATNGDLKYVRWTGTTWDGLYGTAGPDAVDTTGDVGWYTSIALDGNDYPHISYYDYGNDNLKYVRWTGTAWDGLDGTAGPDAVDTTGDVGCYTSIALDGNGYPHISYLDVTNGDLKYVRWTGSIWDGLDATGGPDAVDTQGSVGYDTSIALDGNGYPHISYISANDAPLRCVRWTASAWDGLDATPGPDAVETTGFVGLYTSIALDGNGYPHISYLDVTNGDLKYAWYEE